MEDKNQTKTRENRASLMIRLHKLGTLTEADWKRINLAYVIAKEGHRYQLRDDGTRYFEHLRATAIIIIDELKIRDIDIIIAALLHDMIEDSLLMTVDTIRLNFGERVAALVDAVTKPKRGDKRFRSDEDRHHWYFERIAISDADVKILKLADRLHNMRTLDSCAADKRLRKIAETVKIYLPLAEEIASAYPQQAIYLKDELVKAMNKHFRSIQKYIRAKRPPDWPKSL